MSVHLRSEAKGQYIGSKERPGLEGSVRPPRLLQVLFVSLEAESLGLQFLCCGCPCPLLHPLSPAQTCLGCRQWEPLSPTIFWFSYPQQKLTFFNSTLNTAGLVPEGEDLPILGAHRPGVVTKVGLILFGNDDRMVMVLLSVTCLYYRLQGLRPGS